MTVEFILSEISVSELLCLLWLYEIREPLSCEIALSE